MPHASVRAASTDTRSYDWYSFTVGGPSQGIFDIDHGAGDLILDLYNSAGILLAGSDDAGNDPGSTNYYDPYLTYNFLTAGTYYVRVGDWCCGPTASNYVLNVSLGNTAAVPEPATWAMMLLGFGGIGFAMRRRAKGILQPA